MLLNPLSTNSFHFVPTHVHLNILSQKNQPLKILIFNFQQCWLVLLWFAVKHRNTTPPDQDCFSDLPGKAISRTASDLHVGIIAIKSPEFTPDSQNFQIIPNMLFFGNF